MVTRNISTEVRFDKDITGIDPEAVHKVKLASGAVMPVAAFGTFHSDWAQAYMKDATVEAIRVGWRHIDTARAYENEDVVGEAIREAISRGYISSRDELFITAKLWNGHMSKKDIEPALNNTLRALGVEKVDMYLNHWPWPNVHTPGADGHFRNPHAVPYIHESFMETWGEIVRLKKAGKIVDIGTSNHTEATLKLLLRDTDQSSRPVLNQMEMHPLFQQTQLRRYMESQGITCTGYMSLGSPNRPGRDRFQRAQSRHAGSVDSVDRRQERNFTRKGLFELGRPARKQVGRVCCHVHQNGLDFGKPDAATKDFLTPDQMLAISGDDTPEHPGIDANNRLIWGQVFLWPEALGDWRVLWNDSQVFETWAGYEKFKKSFSNHYTIWKETAVCVPDL